MVCFVASADIFKRKTVAASSVAAGGATSLGTGGGADHCSTDAVNQQSISICPCFTLDWQRLHVGVGRVVLVGGEAVTP